MKLPVIILVLGICICNLSCSSQNSKADKVELQQTKTEVSVDELKKVQDAGGDFQLLDVRTDREVQQGYIAGSVNIDINSGDFNEEVNKLDKNKVTYVYCKVGGRSAMACDKMRKMGFKDVRNVAGGIMSWEGKGFPINK